MTSDATQPAELSDFLTVEVACDTLIRDTITLAELLENTLIYDNDNTEPAEVLSRAVIAKLKHLSTHHDEYTRLARQQMTIGEKQ